MNIGTKINSVGKTHAVRDLGVTAQGVSLRSVSKKYGSFVAVENLNLDIPAGDYCCLLGPSGCGKTTTLRMIAGHEDVTSGDVLIGDRRVNNLPPAKRDTAMMFQNYALFPHKTVWQNVDFGLKMRKIPQSDRRTRVGEMLELIGLSHLAERKPAQLSGGQQQRVALARALVTRPKVLLLDEPLSALDETLRLRMRGELRKIQKQFGMTFIQVTHGVDEAFALSDQIVVMNHGHIEQVATPAEVFRTPASQFVAKFMGDQNIFTGKIINCIADTNSDLIELDVKGIGSLFCRGYGAVIGNEAACSIRADLVELEPYSAATLIPSTKQNHILVRITAVELTGYVTRVSLMVEKTGQELLYKVRSGDWQNSSLQEGQLITLRWSTDDCVFLAH
ncbi:ABC transporter ATP-binding protein [Gloeocapsopsis sp. IPPAS B-1203]|uniref:ABC transporter ATP-binding protein n=1 Tax=Gloeocapsopsis sp. IPPAS B-1203 TaxID=2049454 RepID=UPI000C182868|nr:ABC transporter ATP-binding protein [Gloeocapsopsis sp. IPPAS B-1203]PIG90631.1 transporter [Gloeocapsopsis sp. IPPAS B-1203]